MESMSKSGSALGWTLLSAALVFHAIPGAEATENIHTRIETVDCELGGRRSFLVSSEQVLDVSVCPPNEVEISSEQLKVEETRFPQLSNALRSDPDRGVLTLSHLVEPLLPSVVQIAVLESTDAGVEVIIGSGSGAVIDSTEGLIITNEHVVRDGDRFRVEFADGMDRTAELLGADTGTDIAILRVGKVRGIASLPWNLEGRESIGDVVLAIGYPFGLDQSVSLGLISGVGRSDSNIGSGLQDFVQTDAAINEGNSGGPLLDTFGRIVGIATSGFGGEYNAGVNFAVPALIAAMVSKQIIEHGQVRRGWAGIEYAASSDRLGAAKTGNRVRAVAPHSPAANVDIRVGDLVTHVAEFAVGRNITARALIDLTAPGESIELSLQRNGEAIARKLTVERPPLSRRASSISAAELGIIARSATDEDQTRPDVAGVEIDAVFLGTKSAISGLRRGDIVVRVNNRSVSTLEGFYSLIADGLPLRLLILRGEDMLRIDIR